MTSRRSYIWLATVPVLLFSAWLGARGLNADAIWLDEYYSLYESGGAHDGPLSPAEMLVRVVTNSVWPPGYNIILAIWSAFAGWEPVAGRALFWLLGLLAIAVLYRLGRQLFPTTPLIAFSAAVFLGGSAFYVYYLHELRGYTLHVLLGCCVMSLYWSLLHTTTQRRLKQLGFIAVSILLLYSHPVGQLWLAALAAFHFFLARDNPGWNRILFLFLLAGAAYAPWIGVVLVRMQLQVEMPGGLDPFLILQSAVLTFTNQIPVIIGALCALTFKKLGKQPLQFLWGMLVGLLLLVLLVNYFLSFLFHIRQIIALLPILMLIAAVGLAQLRRIRWIPAMTLGGWLLLGAYLSFNDGYLRDLPGAAPTLPNPGFETARRFLSAHAAPGDAVLFLFGDNDAEFLMSLPLEYYFHESGLRVSLLSMVNADDRSASFPERLRAFVNDSARVWSVEIEGFPSNSNTEALHALLAAQYAPCGTVLDMPDVQLKVYANSASGRCTERASFIFHRR